MELVGHLKLEGGVGRNVTGLSLYLVQYGEGTMTWFNRSRC